MLWDKWIPEHWLRKQVVCGLEAAVDSTGITWHYVILKKNGSRLSIDLSGKCSELSGLPTRIVKDKIPVTLCINGRGIIVRRITLAEGEEVYSEEFLQRQLPGLQMTDFAIQIYTQENNLAFAAVQRKEQCDAIIRQVKTATAELADICIGPPAVMAVARLLSNRNFVHVNFARIDLLNGLVDQIQQEAAVDNLAELDLDGLRIQSDQLLAFSSAFSYLTGQQPGYSTDAALTQPLTRHLEKNKFRIALSFFLGLAFLLCLTNFLIFSSGYSRAAKLDTQLNLYQEKYTRVNELLNAYEQKKALIEETGLLENYSFSGYTDRIAATIPRDVVLTDYQFNPKRDQDLSSDSLMAFEKKVILIRGTCNKSLLINEWVNVLKTQNFIRDVNLEKFLFNTNEQQPNFEIKIITN